MLTDGQMVDKQMAELLDVSVGGVLLKDALANWRRSKLGIITIGKQMKKKKTYETLDSQLAALFGDNPISAGASELEDFSEGLLMRPSWTR